MFKPLETTPREDQVSFSFDGKPIAAHAGMSVAGALFQSGINAIRHTPVSGVPRGPFCMMGACYDCLVQVDGVTVQACQILVTDGLAVSRVPNTHKGAQ